MTTSPVQPADPRSLVDVLEHRARRRLPPDELAAVTPVLADLRAFTAGEKPAFSASAEVLRPLFGMGGALVRDVRLAQGRILVIAALGSSAAAVPRTIAIVPALDVRGRLTARLVVSSAERLLAGMLLFGDPVAAADRQLQQVVRRFNADLEAADRRLSVLEITPAWMTVETVAG